MPFNDYVAIGGELYGVAGERPGGKKREFCVDLPKTRTNAARIPNPFVVLMTSRLHCLPIDELRRTSGGNTSNTFQRKKLLIQFNASTKTLIQNPP